MLKCDRGISFSKPVVMPCSEVVIGEIDERSTVASKSDEELLEHIINFINAGV